MGFIAVLNLRGDFMGHSGSTGTFQQRQSTRRLCGEDPNAATAINSPRRRLLLLEEADLPAGSSFLGTFFFSATRTARRLAVEYGSCTFGDYVLALTMSTEGTTSTTTTSGGYTGGGSSGGTCIDSPILASTSGNSTTTTTSPLPPAPVNDYTDQSTTTTTGATITTAMAPNDIAYALTIKHCPEGFLSGGSTIHNKVFYDAFSILRHSICNCTDNNRYVDPITGDTVAVSKYHGTLHAFVHSSATVCSGPNSEPYDLVASLQGMGYSVKIMDEAVYTDQILGNEYVPNNIANDVGIEDLLSLHAHAMTEYRAVVLVEPRTLMLEPVDEILDTFLSSNRKAMFSLDSDGNVDTGFMIIKPSQDEFDRITDAYRTTTYDLTAGWSGSGIGVGHLGAKGILSYYYLVLGVLDAPSFQIDHCKYANRIDDDCSEMTYGDISVAIVPEECGSPWNCGADATTTLLSANATARCEELFFDWTRKRIDYEDNHLANTLNVDRDGVFRTDLFGGFCSLTESGDTACSNMLSLTTSTNTSTLGSLRSGCIQDATRFNMCLDVHVSAGNNDAWTNALINGANRWESLIVGDTIGQAPAPNDPDFTCDGGMPPLIDDVYVCAKDGFIDGEGGVLGMTQLRYVRGDTNLPISGGITFDAADVQALMADGTWDNLVQHELGHILGIGTLWGQKDLVSGSPPEYTGAVACAAWQELSGCETGCPPLENDGGSVTAGGHWESDFFAYELMSGYTASTEGGTFATKPISTVTAASLVDLGYTVDMSMADSFVLPPAAMCSTATERRRRLRSNAVATDVRQLSTSGEPTPLSEAGKALAKEHGSNYLKRQAKKRPKRKTPSGDIFVGHLRTDVLYKENGNIYLVDTSECLAISETCLVNKECCSGVCGVDGQCVV